MKRIESGWVVITKFEILDGWQAGRILTSEIADKGNDKPIAMHAERDMVTFAKHQCKVTAVEILPCKFIDGIAEY